MKKLIPMVLAILFVWITPTSAQNNPPTESFFQVTTTCNQISIQYKLPEGSYLQIPFPAFSRIVNENTGDSYLVSFFLPDPQDDGTLITRSIPLDIKPFERHRIDTLYVSLADSISTIYLYPDDPYISCYSIGIPLIIK